MKLSTYAKQLGVSYITVWRQWQRGELDAYQLPSGTVIVSEAPKEPKRSDKVAIYARVSSSENKDNLESQAKRLYDFAVAKGYVIHKIVKEVGSGVNDSRPKLASLLQDNGYSRILVEHKDRLTRFGFNHLELLLGQLGKAIEVVNEAADQETDLMQDFVAIITSFCSRLYGQRRSKRKTEKLIQQLEQESADREEPDDPLD